MAKDIRQYLHLYLGAEAFWQIEGRESTYHRPIDYDMLKDADWIKPLLRPLSDMTEEDFKELAKTFFGKDELLFKEYGKVWYACTRVWDEESIGSELDYIQDACDDDPENVLMCDIRSKRITYGWMIWDENYHGLSTSEESEIIRWLLSKGFDLFSLIDEGLATAQHKKI